MKIEISYFSPTSIFNGEILVSANKEHRDKAILEFKGVKGVSTEISTRFDSLILEVEQGDRFYLKYEKEMTYAVNVLSTSIDVDIEIIEKK